MKPYQILHEKKLFSNGENMIFPFKWNQSKDCPERRSSMRTWKSGLNKIIIKIAWEVAVWISAKNKMIPKFLTMKLCLFNTVENDHQTITFSYLCLILRKISIEDKAQRSKILSLRVAPPILQFGHVAMFTASNMMYTCFPILLIFWILPNLAKYSYGWLPHDQHHKIEK